MRSILFQTCALDKVVPIFEREFLRNLGARISRASEKKKLRSPHTIEELLYYDLKKLHNNKTVLLKLTVISLNERCK